MEIYPVGINIIRSTYYGTQVNSDLARIINTLPSSPGHDHSSLNFLPRKVTSAPL